MTDKIPSLVAGLAAQVKMTPIAWKEYPDRVVIVFQEGPKISFDRALETELPPVRRATTLVKPIREAPPAGGKPATSRSIPPGGRTSRKGR